jgi:membrane-associated phospholipid phosphatase
MPHTQEGEVEPGKYETLLRALATGRHEDFEAVARGSGRKLVNPQGAFAFSLEGGDSHRFACPPAPSFTSAEAAAEMRELYWQALCRDIPFADYQTSGLITQACDDLGATPRTIFRGPTPGDLEGPYISQFLWQPVPYHSGKLDLRYRTPIAGSDFLTSYGEWLQIQTGVPPWRSAVYDETPRYIRNGRDLAEWVHYDYLYQAFVNAALILLKNGPENVLYDNPFYHVANPYKHSKVQQGFVTFGTAEIVDWLGRVTTAAMKAAWRQKWGVHRRLRPEAFGGRLHHTKMRQATGFFSADLPESLGDAAVKSAPAGARKTRTVRLAALEYPIHPDLANSPAAEEVFRRTGSYLLPQAYPEGSPLHPSYPSGHATVAGACSAILKACFDEEGLIPDCVHATPDGLALEPCPPSFAATVGNEVNKLAFNIAMARDWAGIHYRSDATAGLRLGEEVGISVLQDLVRCCTEDFEGFSFTRFDGTPVKIGRNGEVT